ncbi:MAG: hypothetical protein EOM50_02415 [Erysipelotrichia bacterium]|nr:hypothetical protein [Erysipelotrichia bacterium]NCC54808.1 hypothetical protein [Erysipelotrichia bacterium]
MYDVSLPKYLEKDIEQLLNGINNDDSLLDCMLDELYGSINSAFWDGIISEKHARHLREKYLVYREDNTDGKF